MAFAGAIAIIALLGGFVYYCVKSWEKDDLWTKKVVINNVLMLVVVLAIVWFTFPIFSNWFLYQTVILNVFYIVPTGIGVLVIALAAWSNEKGRLNNSALLAVYIILGVAIVVGGTKALPSLGEWRVAETYQPTKVSTAIATNPNAVRFTPLQVAYSEMRQSINASQFTVESDLIDPVSVDGGFGYVAPVTPDDWWPTLSKKADGFVVFNDDPRISDTDRRRRVDQPFQVGENMEWLDDIWRTLYQADMFCEYTEIYYLQLDPSDPDNFTAVAPKIKYRYSAPIFWIPVWGGVTLVHSDGTVEELSPKQAMSDKRLSGKMIFPTELVRRMVDVQIWDRGPLSGFINREGKIEVPELPGGNQMPFVVVSNGGVPYGLVTAEPSGESEAIFRIYAVDLTTGSFTFLEYDASEGLIGPRAAIDRARSSLSGYVWVEDMTCDEARELGDSGGLQGFRVLEPRPITKKGVLYWLVTVTSQKCVGVSETLVVNSASGNVSQFDDRQTFTAWLGGSTYHQPDSSSSTTTESQFDELSVIKDLLTEALERLEALGTNQ